MNNKRQNIVVCMCDQLRSFEVGSYGNSCIRTPNIDALAEQGVLFEHAVSNNPVCQPARSCLISGQYSRTCTGELNNHFRLDENGNWYFPDPPSETRDHFANETMPEILKQNGYTTGLVGKWHILPKPQVVGFDYACYPMVHHRNYQQAYFDNDKCYVVDQFAPEFEMQKVRHFIAENKNEPFFLYYNISLPHMPLLDAPEKYLSMYDPESIPLRGNAGLGEDEDFNRRWFKIYYNEYHPEAPRIGFDDSYQQMDLKKMTALYYGLTTCVDDQVGKLMECLKEEKVLDNTIILFLSDHGDMLGSHGCFNKNVLYEESIRIPFIYYAPKRFGQGKRVTQIGQIIDIMPTILECCNIAIPDFVQGRSCADILQGKQTELENNWAFIETDAAGIGIRTPEYLYGIGFNSKTRERNDDLYFYNVHNDPLQQYNLLGTGKDSAEAEKLKALLENWDNHTPWFIPTEV